MDDVTTNRPDEARTTGSAWSSLVWTLSALAVVLLVAGVWVRLSDESAGTGLIELVAAGERPVAPELPSTGIDRDGAPGLPAWYASSQGATASPTDDASATTGRRVVLVNWWASWCGPCKEEAPLLQQLANDYRGRVDVVAVDAGAEDLESDARRFVRHYRWSFPVVRGARSDKDAWGVRGYPETFVVGLDGRVAAHVNGSIDGAEVREVLDAELGRHA